MVACETEAVLLATRFYTLAVSIISVGDDSKHESAIVQFVLLLAFSGSPSGL